jgi:hypothetical protein
MRQKCFFQLNLYIGFIEIIILSTWAEGEKETLPKLNTKILQQHEPEEGMEYTIIDVSDFVSPKGDKAFKVILNSFDKEDKTEYATILWKRDQIGAKSKLGAFIIALAKINENGQPVQNSNTDEWLNVNIRFIHWSDKNREIKVIA